jgi:hypothetical protein
MAPPRFPSTPRPRHPDKDIERLMQQAEARGWVFTWGRGYPKGWCPCGLHQKTIHLTPNRAYLRNLAAWFHRLDCWEEKR